MSHKWDEFCSVCKGSPDKDQPGEPLLNCKECPRSFHASCAGLKQGAKPSKFTCPRHKCVFDGCSSTSLKECTEKSCISFACSDHMAEHQVSHMSDNFCFACQWGGGSLILCDHKPDPCPRVFHTECLGLKKSPSGKYVCPRHKCSHDGCAEDKKLEGCAYCLHVTCSKHRDEHKQKHEKMRKPPPRREGYQCCIKECTNTPLIDCPYCVRVVCSEHKDNHFKFHFGSGIYLTAIRQVMLTVKRKLRSLEIYELVKHKVPQRGATPEATVAGTLSTHSRTGPRSLFCFEVRERQKLYWVRENEFIRPGLDPEDAGPPIARTKKSRGASSTTTTTTTPPSTKKKSEKKASAETTAKPEKKKKEKLPKKEKEGGEEGASEMEETPSETEPPSTPTHSRIDLDGPRSTRKSTKDSTVASLVRAGFTPVGGSQTGATPRSSGHTTRRQSRLAEAALQLPFPPLIDHSPLANPNSARTQVHPHHPGLGMSSGRRVSRGFRYVSEETLSAEKQLRLWNMTIDDHIEVTLKPLKDKKKKKGGRKKSSSIGGGSETDLGTLDTPTTANSTASGGVFLQLSPPTQPQESSEIQPEAPLSSSPIPPSPASPAPCDEEMPPPPTPIEVELFSPPPIPIPKVRVIVADSQPQTQTQTPPRDVETVGTPSEPIVVSISPPADSQQSSQPTTSESESSNNNIQSSQPTQSESSQGSLGDQLPPEAEPKREDESSPQPPTGEVEEKGQKSKEKRGKKKESEIPRKRTRSQTAAAEGQKSDVIEPPPAKKEKTEKEAAKPLKTFKSRGRKRKSEEPKVEETPAKVEEKSPNKITPTPQEKEQQTEEESNSRPSLSLDLNLELPPTLPSSESVSVDTTAMPNVRAAPLTEPSPATLSTEPLTLDDVEEEIWQISYVLGTDTHKTCSKYGPQAILEISDDIFAASQGESLTRIGQAVGSFVPWPTMVLKDIFHTYRLLDERISRLRGGVSAFLNSRLAKREEKERLETQDGRKRKTGEVEQPPAGKSESEAPEKPPVAKKPRTSKAQRTTKTPNPRRSRSKSRGEPVVMLPDKKHKKGKKGRGKKEGSTPTQEEPSQEEEMEEGEECDVAIVVDLDAEPDMELQERVETQVEVKPEPVDSPPLVIAEAPRSLSPPILATNTDTKEQEEPSPVSALCSELLGVLEERCESLVTQIKAAKELYRNERLQKLEETKSAIEAHQQTEVTGLRKLIATKLKQMEEIEEADQGAPSEWWPFGYLV